MSKDTLTLIIFIVTYIGIIFTRLPKVNIDRPSAAFFGAISLIVFGIVSFKEAVELIDYYTIGLLLGMMIIISTLQQDGFFQLIAYKTISYSSDQRRLLDIIVYVTGIASAFLVNDAVVLLFTPVIISICKKSNLNPVPYLIGEILASNIGSAMTITGNPQNMLIGIASGVSFSKFMFSLFPISILGMWFTAFMIKRIYRKEFSIQVKIKAEKDDLEYNYASMNRSVPIFLLVVVGFFLSKYINLSISVIALAGASLILLLGKIKPSQIIAKVDWVLLLFFASLFIVVGVVEKAGYFDYFIHNSPIKENFSGVLSIHSISLVLSQIISNVPLTIIMVPILTPLNSEIMWFSLASATTLAGNATIIGAMANLIVIESAEKYNVKIKFFEFLKTGLPVTIITLVFSTFYFYLLFLILQ